MEFRSVLFVLTFKLFLINPSQTYANSNYEESIKSAVFVMAKVKSKEEVVNFGGSGVIIGDGSYILTSYHTIRDKVKKSTLACIHQSSKNINAKLWNNNIVDKYYSSDQCEVVHVSEKFDLALLKRKSPYKVPFKPIQLSSRTVVVGEKIHGVFSPSTILGTYYESYVNNIIMNPNFLPLEGFTKSFSLSKAIGYSAPVAKGASGAMLLNKQGELIGITYANIFATNTGLAISGEDIRTFLNESKKYGY